MSRSLRNVRAAPTPTGAALLLFGACAACVAPSAAPAPRGLAYAEPDPNPVLYTFSDSATFIMDAPGYGAMEVETAQHGTAELRFASAAEGFRVRVRFPSFEGSFRNVAQGVSRTNASDIGGAVGVGLSVTGEVTVVDTPSVSPALLDVVGPESLVRPFFVRLPGRTVEAGAVWVDTVRTSEEVAGTVSRGTSVVTSRLVGDTVVGDRRLLRITTATETSVEVSGVSGGVDIEQVLRGTVSGEVLWDGAAHLLVERAEQGELSGTLEMPGTGVEPIPVSARVRRRVSLRP